MLDVRGAPDSDQIAPANLEYSVIHFLDGVLIHGGVWASLTK